MDTSIILLKMIMQNIQYIVPVFLFLILISLAGISYWLTFVKEKNFYLLLSASFITGAFTYSIFLAILSYFFKARDGIFLITAIYFGLAILLFLKNYKDFPLPKLKFSLNNIFVLFTVALISVYLFFQIGANIYGGDVIAYWGFATSFANGNYPMVAPWQPEWLAIHHQSTYLVEGAVYGLTSANMKLIHSIYAYFIVTSGIFVLWSFAAEKTKKTKMSLLAALVVFISFGALFIPMPRFIASMINPEVTHITGKLPMFINAKNRLGGASNLPDLIYISHRGASLVGMFLIFILMNRKFRKRFSFYAPSLIAIFSMAVISSDEGYMPSIGLAVIAWFFIKAFKNLKEAILSFGLAGIIFILAFFLFGSALRDSFLNPPFSGTRFIFLTDPQLLAYRFREFKGALLYMTEQSNIAWYLPSVWHFFLLAFLFWIVRPTKYGIYLILGAIGAAISSIFVEHTYYPGNNGRFLHIIYPLLSLSIVISILRVLKTKYYRFSKLKLISITILMFYVLEIFFTMPFLIRRAKEEYYPNLAGKLPEYEVLAWSQENIPNENIMFIDGYLRGKSYCYLCLVGTQDYGLMVPVGPAFVKAHTPDFGPEAIDVITSLSPGAINDLNIPYVFIAHEYKDQFPEERLDDIANKKYFIPVYTDALGTMYEITSLYLSEGPETNNTFRYLEKVIPKDASVFIEYPPPLDHYLRANFALIFRNRKKIVTEHRHGMFNYIETRIPTVEPSLDDKYDYLFLGLEKDPLEVCNCEEVELFWETYGARGYKVIK